MLPSVLDLRNFCWGRR